MSARQSIPRLFLNSCARGSSACPWWPSSSTASPLACTSRVTTRAASRPGARRCRWVTVHHDSQCDAGESRLVMFRSWMLQAGHGVSHTTADSSGCVMTRCKLLQMNYSMSRPAVRRCRYVIVCHNPPPAAAGVWCCATTSCEKECLFWMQNTWRKWVQIYCSGMPIHCTLQASRFPQINIPNRAQQEEILLSGKSLNVSEQLLYVYTYKHMYIYYIISDLLWPNKYAWDEHRT